MEPYEVRIFPRDDPAFVSDVGAVLQELSPNPTIGPRPFPVEAFQARLAGRHPAVLARLQDPLATLTGRQILYVFRDGAALPAQGAGPWIVLVAGSRKVPTDLDRDGALEAAPWVTPRSTIRAELDQAVPASPSRRMIVVTVAGHRNLVERAAEAGPGILEQPAELGSAPAILLAASWVASQEPSAMMVVLPMDLDLGHDPAGLGQIFGLVARTPDDPDRLLLVGIPATAPETDHGWIEPGAVIATTAGQPIRSVRRFVDQPSPEVAQAIHAKGWLWSAGILVGRAAAFLTLGRSYLPWLVGPLETAVQEAAHAPLDAALRHAYAGIRRADVSRDLLELVPERLGVAVLPGLGSGKVPARWSDP
jgi:hypothetical protein